MKSRIISVLISFVFLFRTDAQLPTTASPSLLSSLLTSSFPNTADTFDNTTTTTTNVNNNSDNSSSNGAFDLPTNASTASTLSSSASSSSSSSSSPSPSSSSPSSVDSLTSAELWTTEYPDNETMSDDGAPNTDYNYGRAVGLGVGLGLGIPIVFFFSFLITYHLCRHLTSGSEDFDGKFSAQRRQMEMQ